MLVLRILFGICIILFLVSLYILIVKKPLKNKFRYPFKEDIAIKINQLAQGYADFVFENVNSNKYIDEYILSKRGKKKYITVSYIDEYEDIEYIIVSYDGRKKVNKVIKVKDTTGNKTSKIIKLKKKTKFVNVIVTRVNKEDVYLSPLCRVSVFRILGYTLVNFISFFSLAYISYWLMIEIFGSIIKTNYVNDYFFKNLIIILASDGVFSLFIMIMAFIKNGYFKRKAGVIYNEF